jgi:hypothetical protein
MRNEIQSADRAGIASGSQSQTSASMTIGKAGAEVERDSVLEVLWQRLANTHERAEHLAERIKRLRSRMFGLGLEPEKPPDSIATLADKQPTISRLVQVSQNMDAVLTLIDQHLRVLEEL